MTVAEFKKRLARLEEKTGRKFVTFTMQDGTIRKMVNTRLIEVLTESLVEDGIRGEDYITIMSSVGNNSDHKLISLLKDCID